MSEFLNKRNINAQAITQVDLILGGEKGKIKAEQSEKGAIGILMTHPEMKAKAILDLTLVKTASKNAAEQSSYVLVLKDKTSDTPYLQLKADAQGKIGYEILNNDIFEKKIHDNTIESSVLRATIRQIELGSLAKSLEQAHSQGDIAWADERFPAENKNLPKKSEELTAKNKSARVEFEVLNEDKLSSAMKERLQNLRNSLNQNNSKQLDSKNSPNPNRSATSPQRSKTGQLSR